MYTRYQTIAYCSLIVLLSHLVTVQSSGQWEERILEAIILFLNRYKRPFTILDIGTTDIRRVELIANHYYATLVIASCDTCMKVEEFCQKNGPSSVIFLKKGLSLFDLERLGECEHFDVIMMIDDFNAMPLARKVAISFIVNLGEYFILQVPQATKTKGVWTRADEIRSYLLEAGASVMEEIMIDDACLFLVQKKKNFICRSYWTHAHKALPGDYLITSTFKEKSLYKRMTQVQSVWHPGINMHTFKALCGIYPGPELLATAARELESIDHNDYNPCNFILQGHALVPIDFNDPRRTVDHTIGYNRLMHMIAG